MKILFLFSFLCILVPENFDNVDSLENFKILIKKLQKQPPRGVPPKRCSEKMQQIYRTPFTKNISERLLLKLRPEKSQLVGHTSSYRIGVFIE